MSIQTVNVDFKRKRHFIPAMAHSLFIEGVADAGGGGDALGSNAGVLNTANVGDQLITPTGLAAQGAQYGFHLTAPALGVATSKLVVVTGGLLGVDMKVNSLIEHIGLIPDDVDVDREIGVRVVFTHGSATATDTVTWIVLHDSGHAPGAAYAAPATALDTVIGATTLTGAAANQIWRSGRGVINASKFASTDWTWAFRTELDATLVDTTTEGVFFLGLELDYVPSVTYGRKSNRNRKLTTQPLGTTES